MGASNRKVVGSTPVGRTRNFFFREYLCHSLKKYHSQALLLFFCCCVFQASGGKREVERVRHVVVVIDLTMNTARS